MIDVDGHHLSIEDVVRVARERAAFRVPDGALRRVAASRAFLERCVSSGRTIYGVNTGVGHLARVSVPLKDLAALQRNIVLSHAAGVGPDLDDDEVRAILLLKLNLFAHGCSGVRTDLVERLGAMLERGILPVIPAKGSLGASGDLAPLAHVAAAVIGEGEVRVQGRRMRAADALQDAGLAPFELSYKEGLGLINGCQLMAARGILLLHDARIALRTAQAVTAVAVEALGASTLPFDARVHAHRPYPGQKAVAANLRRLLAGRASAESTRVQDPYSLRCVPQILGGVADAFDDLERRLTIEVNAASDNPLVFAEDEVVLAAGNFHGESLGLALDFFGLAVAEIASLAERQANRLLHPALSEGLPPFLALADGLHSGLMIFQYTAASLVSENKVLAHPACADSIPVSGDQEDHVSMGATAAHKAAEILRNTIDVIAVAAIVAAQAIELRGGTPVPAVAAFRDALREEIPFWREDRYASPDLKQAAGLVRSGRLLSAAERVAGTLDGSDPPEDLRGG
jgi:histidine ammonia-lyase